MYTSLVSGRIAAAYASASPERTNVVSTPNRARVPSSSVRVPPYSCADETMWSPLPHRAAIARNSADWPLEVATAPIAPSRLAMRSSNAATVGFEMRL